MRKDKKQVIGEEIGDEAIKLFLLPEPADDTPPSLHKLIKAYRGLRIDDFERYIGFFQAAGYDLGARDAKGRDFIELVADQHQARPYIEVIEAALG
ncbi:PA4642 family protein [Pseudomonas stutzeri]|jgi:phosphoglycolate phosphatase-like HAD superfamily hydrolase|uniref:PA4642 family protein n=1 Tax=Pseudomonas TaxID=286 RepID=UPI00051DAFC1|nr:MULTISPECIES: PA4642 family protein [Pseudomonas]KGK84396.1 aminopeptidase [Stutzerimonas degradans]MCF6753753.1 PA4642 family protein [Stutzerimonas stutzeri]MDT3708859.1 PA4642 family protein [Pseudomonadaceae bacterium]MCQ4232708.1 PA4642 family protein [Stutzerimonas degradans]MCQ4265692.1 PA4642 family protein [Stutzerimonas degradans]